MFLVVVVVVAAAADVQIIVHVVRDEEAVVYSAVDAMALERRLSLEHDLAPEQSLDQYQHIGVLLWFVPIKKQWKKLQEKEQQHRSSTVSSLSI
jgi:hypothetical protein